MSDDYSVDLPAGYDCEFTKSDVEDEDCLSIRLSLATAAEWKSWVDEFERKSSQKFIVKKTYSEPVR